MNYYEVNFDGMIGPTHNYSGLSYGNIASMKHKNQSSNPREGALQCLNKMKFLADLGLIQGILPPHERPHINTLRHIGFTGSDEDVILHAYQEVPEIFFSCCSSSSVWAANAATVTPSTDTRDGKVHITPANLPLEFHRSIEHQNTAAILKKIFFDTDTFVHHCPLPLGNYFSDEGAANHTRFYENLGDPGVHLFVYGKQRFKQNDFEPLKYPARQSYEASQAIARQHTLASAHLLFEQQNPVAIDAGVFHNDVISVGHGRVFLCHEMAFIRTQDTIDAINKKLPSLIPIVVRNDEISIEEAVKTYLFNSQIVTVPSGHMQLISPIECQNNSKIKKFLDHIVADTSNPIHAVNFLNLNESMQNGGGPACLRLRVVLNEQELQKINSHVLLTDELFNQVEAWINRHYRDYLVPQDLADPSLLIESRQALDEFTKILHLGPIYSFQQ